MHFLQNSNSRSLLFFLFIVTLLSFCRAHSYLTRPEPYTRDQCKGCSACQPEKRNMRKMHHTSANPFTTWGRGQEVDVRWAKNNHQGGFIRLSLVPVHEAFNPNAHKHYAFYYGCFEQNLYSCSGRDCGADNRGQGFRRTVTIPDVVPDGIYAFAFMWYGGIHFRRKRGLFSDYTSCAYVRIQGGNKLNSWFQPFFQAGYLGRYEHYGTCLTSAIEPGACRTGCDNVQAWHSLPKLFLNNMKPNVLTPKDYGVNSW